jgi:ketosteroid isomerase-like protein
MTPEENKAGVQRFYELVEDVFRTGDTDVLDEVLAPEFVFHQPGLHQISKATNNFLPCSGSPALT